MNDLFKKAIQAGLGLAVITTEKVKEIVDDLVEKEKVADFTPSDENENKENQEKEDFYTPILEETLKKFQQIKSEEYEKLEQRISRLEYKWKEFTQKLKDKKKV